MNEIILNLWLGDRDDAVQIGEDPDWVIISVVDYPENETPNEPKTAKVMPIMKPCDSPLHGIAACPCRTIDDLTIPSKLDRVAVAIDKALFWEKKKVLVHCVGGIDRSPLAVAWYLYRGTGFADSIESAYEIVKAKRPEIRDRTHWLPRTYRHQPKPEDFRRENP